MKTFTFIVTVIVFNLLFTTCKKYPDGGNDFRAYKKIIGYYTLSLYEVNGIDSTNLINYNSNENYKKIWIREPDVKEKNAFNISNVNPTCGLSARAILTNSKKTLKITSEIDKIGFSKTCAGLINGTIGCCRLIFYPEGQNTYWVIEKLTRNELVLSCQLTNAYKIKLTK